MNQVDIHIKGLIDEQRSDWFEGFAIVHVETNETLLHGFVVDQTALFGLLTKVRDLGLPLISVQVMPVTGGETRGE